MDERATSPGPWGLLVALAALIALAAKLWLAAHTSGTVDILSWQHFLAEIDASGGAGVYDREVLFNHPPFMIHLLRALGALQSWSGAPFAFWLRLPGILADVGTVALVWRLRDRLAPAPIHPVTIVLLALAPASPMISGYHGNTDSLMIFFVVLAAFLAERHPSGWPAGAALGMAMNIKIAAAIFLPVFVLSRRSWRDRVAIPAAAAATAVLASTPYLFDHAGVIAQRVLGYAGGKTPWGVPLLLDVARERVLAMLLVGQPPIPLSVLVGAYHLVVHAAALYAAGSRPALLAGLCLAAWWMNRRRQRLPLFSQCAVSAGLFLVVAPGFGVQYLAWMVPWVAAAGALPAALFHLASGAFLYRIYSVDYFGSPTEVGRSLLCWAAIGVVVGVCLRLDRAGRRRAVLTLAAVAVCLLAAARWDARRQWADERPVVVASSTMAGYAAAATVDGDRDASHWETGGGWHSDATPRPETPQFLTFIFPRPRSIGRIDLVAYPDPRYTLTSFVFQRATGDGWLDVEATRVADNAAGTSWSFAVADLDVEILRLRIDGAADAYARVLEVEFADASTARAADLSPP